jgi:hypothetical protein
VRAERSAAAAGWEGGRRREMTGLTLRGHFRQFFHVGAAACETCGFGGGRLQFRHSGLDFQVRSDQDGPGARSVPSVSKKKRTVTRDSEHRRMLSTVISFSGSLLA